MINLCQQPAGVTDYIPYHHPPPRRLNCALLALFRTSRFWNRSSHLFLGLLTLSVPWDINIVRR